MDEGKIPNLNIIPSRHIQSELEIMGQEYLKNLKGAIENKDKTLLRETILVIQKFVNMPNKNTEIVLQSYSESNSILIQI